jgi:uncharacterized membrane protein
MKGKVSSLAISFLLGISAFCLVANTFNLVPVQEFPISFIGACLGALVSAVVTLLVVRSQADDERTKDRDKERFAVRFKKKAEIYEKYIVKLRRYIADGTFTEDERNDLIEDTTFELQMYLEPKDGGGNKAKDIIECIKKMWEQRSDRNAVGTQAVAIMEVLHADLEA